MRVGVTLFGPYARLLPPGSSKGRAVLDLDDGLKVADVLDRLQVPEAGRSYVTLNGERAGLETAVAEADEIRVVVPLGGG